MTKINEIVPLSLKDAPALIEKVLPVQRLSIDVYKERMAGSGQTLTSLGSYWKGRKPLVLNRACILGALLPATGNTKRDLEVFEMLMSMDDESMRKRLQLRDDESLPRLPYKTHASKAKRAEEIIDSVHTHIWEKVNAHLGTNARNYAQLVEQLGIMRYGHRPRVADTFSGSGQIPFEASRLGCDAYASDLNPIACLLTWSAFRIAGSSEARRQEISNEQARTIAEAKEKIDALGVETDGKGWRGKVYLYCLEVLCPTSGWRVPVLQSLVVSVGYRVVARLIPDATQKRYHIVLDQNATDAQLKNAEVGTITRNSRYGEAFLTHTVDGIQHRNSISSIRGDYVAKVEGADVPRNRLRQWENSDLVFKSEDILGERLYAVQWIEDTDASRPKSEFREVTKDDLKREEKILAHVQKNLTTWQNLGYLPDLRIEPGAPPRYQGRSLIVERGWTHWHHAFNPRQLLLNATLFSCCKTPESLSMTMRGLDVNSRLSVWHRSDGGGGSVQKVFMNQALNPLYDYGSRGLVYLAPFISSLGSHAPVVGQHQIINGPANDFSSEAELFITDPPYGDAVKYEELLDFFIAWVRKNSFPEFQDWVWDSRRALAVKGEDHDFKLGMVAVYKRMTDHMPDNGMQIVMFTHQSGAIWADMANIVWASGLRVTAAWYVVTETDSALRDGQYVKGTILLVLRKRLEDVDAARDELAYELAEEVKTQVDLLTGLNKDVKELYRDENLFEDADLQMAGYAAALRVLTRYSQIDGVSMTQEAMRPRVKGQTTMVDELIAFAVNIANEYLVPEGVDRAVWEKSTGIERFYLKMLDMESKGIHVLSNYQNFAKAFKVQDYGAVMDEVRANHANLKSAAQLGKRGMTAGEEFGPTVLRSVLYAIHLLQENKVKPEDILHQLRDLIPDYFRERDRIIALADYVNKKTAKARPDESSNAMVLRDLVRRERV